MQIFNSQSCIIIFPTYFSKNLFKGVDLVGMVNFVRNARSLTDAKMVIATKQMNAYARKTGEECFAKSSHFFDLINFTVQFKYSILPLDF